MDLQSVFSDSRVGVVLLWQAFMVTKEDWHWELTVLNCCGIGTVELVSVFNLDWCCSCRNQVPTGAGNGGMHSGQ